MQPHTDPTQEEYVDYEVLFDQLNDAIAELEEDFFIQAMRLAIIVAYQAKGWNGMINEAGDVYIEHEDFGHAYFENFEAPSNGHAFYHSYWSRHDGSVPDISDETFVPMQARKMTPLHFAEEIAHTTMHSPMYGGDFFKDEYDIDPEFTEPDYRHMLIQTEEPGDESEVELDEDYESSIDYLSNLP
jgi:hypothetical protein